MSCLQKCGNKHRGASKEYREKKAAGKFECREYKGFPGNSRRTSGGLHTVSNERIEHRCGIKLEGNTTTQKKRQLKIKLEIQQKGNKTDQPKYVHWPLTINVTVND